MDLCKQLSMQASPDYGLIYNHLHFYTCTKMAYFEAKFKSNGDKTSPCFRPF